MFESAGVDFLVLHPRTVVQEYTGHADHAVTAEVVRQTRLPVIANGDIRSASEGLQVLRDTGAAGLMLGRGAIADPLLFSRLRGTAPAEPDRSEKSCQLGRYLRDLVVRYRDVFCGDMQVLSRVKAVVATMHDPLFEKDLRQLQKARNLPAFTSVLDELV